MAIKETLTIDAAVIRAYGIGTTSSVSAPLTGGKINTTVVVHQPDLLLQRLAHPLHPAWVDEYQRIQQALVEQKVLIPSLLPTVDGKYVVVDSSGATWRAFELFEHETPTNYAHVDPSRYGQLLARTHLALAAGCDWQPRYTGPVPHFHETEHFVQRLADETAQLPSAVGRHLARDLVTLHRHRLPPLPSDDEPQIIHGDPKLPNMLFSTSKDPEPHTLIDWETYFWGSVWVDLGDLLRSLAKLSLVEQGRVDHTQLLNVIGGYHSISSRGISIESFTQVAYSSARRLCVELASRYLLDYNGALFAWDSDAYPSAHTHNLQRAIELRQVLRCLTPGPLVFVDYDRTLFRTDAFKQHLFEWLAKSLQKSVLELDEAARALRTDPRLGGFDFKAFVQGFGADMVNYEQELRALLLNGDYLYDDAIPFMRGLVARGLHPIILTYGDYHFQYEKILPFVNQLGTDEYVVPAIVMSEPKGEYIARQFPRQRGLLIDDKIGQKLPENFTEIWLNRVDEKEASEPCIHTVHNLGEALEVIASLNLTNDDFFDD